MPHVARNCPHVSSQSDPGIIEIAVSYKDRFTKCSECESEGPNLWLCLYPDCRWVGCAETNPDHSSVHNSKFPNHSIHMNLCTNRFWCYSCGNEVFAWQNSNQSNQIDFKKFAGDASSIDTKSTDLQRLLVETFLESRRDQELRESRISSEKGDAGNDKFSPSDSPDSTDSDDGKDFSGKPRGLVGLQNIGNTCYMNAALQALSNVPPLTQFFLDCAHMATYISKDRKHGLSLSYLNLVRDMWNRKNRGYVVPHGILTGIRTVHPMFRGYHQHDTQEFLRCFMDQLHEELKEHVEDDNKELRLKNFGEHSSDDEETEIDGGTGSSQSDAEYETCDSGVSEQSSLSDEGERGTKRRYSRVSQSDKGRNNNNKFTTRTNVVGEFSGSQRSSQNSPKKQIKTKSIISDTFDGKLLSSVECLTCNRISTRVETFQDLSLPIPSRDHIDMLHQGSLTPQKAGPCSDVVYVTNQSGWFTWFFQWMRSWFWGPVVSLHDCLSAFFSADELKGDNMYSCEKCNKLRNGIKFSKVLELPEVLCVHLKRFRHELMFSSKIANFVSFPLEGLDMRPYLHKECVSQVTTYDLISVICHHGTAGGGHYTCYALNPIVSQWFEFDDQCVTQVPPETVSNCEAYVLFYKKSSPEMMRLRDKTMELMELSAREPSDLNFFVSRQWINRFNTFSEPGPIDNSDFLCPHGGVNPIRAQFVDKISMPIPQAVWEFLYSQFGGGPACTHLYECPICEEKYESLEKRRLYEMDMFQRLNHNSENPTSVYALAMAWLRQWQSFAKRKEIQPPGPIDNSSIVVNKNGQIVLKAGSDYGQIPEELWQFLLNIYGGGPELMLHCQRPLPQTTSAHEFPDSSTTKRSEATKAIGKISATKSAETILQQQESSAIEGLTSENDFHQWLRDSGMKQ